MHIRKLYIRYASILKMLDALKVVSWTTDFLAAASGVIILIKQKAESKDKVLFLISKASQAPLIEK